MEIDISSFFDVNKIITWSILISVLIFLILLHLLRNSYIKEEYTSKNVEDEKSH